MTFKYNNNNCIRFLVIFGNNGNFKSNEGTLYKLTINTNH